MNRLIVWSFLAVSAMSQAQAPREVDRAAAYYNYAMGHMYAELAAMYGNRSEHVNKAIDHLREVLKLDPGARLACEELSDLYIQAGRLREAVTDAEAALRQNPNDLNSRRILGRIYSRMIGDAQGGRVREDMVKKAIEQYEKISEIDPKDIETWLTLGRLHKVAQSSVDSEKAFQKALDLEPDNEEALTGLALVYADLGDVKKASLLLHRVAQKNPNMRTLTTLASMYEQMREFKLAAEMLRKALELSQGHVEIKRALAQNLMFSDQTDEALKLFEEVIQEDEKDVQSYLRLSQIYRQKGQFEKARKAGDKAKALAPDNIEILYNEVSLLEAEGKGDEAIQAMKAIVDSTEKKSYSQNEKSSRVMLLERLGLLYRANERFAEALAVFRSIADLDPAVGGRITAQIVDTHRQARDFTKALAEAEEGIRKYPDERLLKTVYATSLADVGKGEAAVAAVKKLFDGKSDRETWMTMAQVQEKTKDFAGMGRSLAEAEKLAGDDDDKLNIHFMRGAMYEKQKKHDESESEFRKVLAIDPDNASALNYLGYMLADRNVRLTEAHDMIQKALKMDPNNGAYLDSLGWVYFRQGRLEEAEDYLRRALRRVPRDPTIHDHLGDVLAQQSRLKDAVAEWERAIQEWESSAPSEVDRNEVAKIRKKVESGRVRLAKESGRGAR
ncbi:MAG: tetratricopeptide repeat protein [Bryobacteraceae bacterium]